MQGKKYFPIQTKTACQLKWAWSTIMLPNGVTSSCHRVTPHKFEIKEFNFHNTPEKIDQRNTMLAGDWPAAGCNYCQRIEETKVGQSDRQFFLNVPDLTPTELDINPLATTVTPTILEIYLDNTCNLGCLYCNPSFSSRIDTESKRFGTFNKNGVILTSEYQPVDDQKIILDQYWEWMKNNASKLKRLHILGGEPFFQPNFKMFFDFFNNYPCPHTEFNIVTNLALPKHKLIDYMSQFKELIFNKKIRRLDITASIDCWGPEQEFTRYGLKLPNWQENFEYLLDQPWIKLNINSTISVLTIKTMPELIIQLNKWGNNRKIEHYFAQVFDPSFMAPKIFGPNEFKEDFNKILNLMETGSWRGTHAYTHMNGIFATIANSEIDKNEILKLITFLDEMDRRRNTDWRKVFSWLIKYEDICGIIR